MDIQINNPNDISTLTESQSNSVWDLNVHQMKCAEHNSKGAGLSVSGDESGEIQVSLDACCQNFADKVIAKCRTANELRRSLLGNKS